MDKVLKKLFPYTLLFIGAYFLVPAIVISYGNLEEEALSRVLLYLEMSFNPGVAFFCGLFFSSRNGFKWFFLLDVGIISFLACMFFFSPELLMFVVIAVVGGLLGCFVGSMMKKHIDEMYL